ncbi:hypothetical protein HQ308_09705 [Rhodococcus sp. BP-241]|uniref:hypothetical protein n=1 Tax=Rhodococcus sp. BP-241 TaxID=2739441 RepID=UPI001C9A96F9|nr:hypothetical protein [Rhodococcus sp. BP-241]MBY6707078.1 hypothetical protein [Rhodococcus sp. BP-241]
MVRIGLRRVVGGVLAAGAITAGSVLAGAGTASAEPTYVGPLYYEVVPGIFPTCPDVAAAERAKGTTILVDCIRWFGPQRGFSLTPYQLIAGIAPLDGS